jgi:hypothetical protein
LGEASRARRQRTQLGQHLVNLQFLDVPQLSVRHFTPFLKEFLPAGFQLLDTIAYLLLPFADFTFGLSGPLKLGL